MKDYRWMHLGMFLVLAVSVVGLVGCAAGGAGGGEGEGEGEGEAGELTANFDEAGGGNFAVAQDEAGNEYTFRDRADGSISEGNVLFTDGTAVKASLDSQGRPVKFRSSTGENADVSYGNEGARVRYLAAGADPQDAGAYEDVTGIDTTSAKARVLAQRQAASDKRTVAMQGDREEPVNTRSLREGFETFEETTESMLDDSANPIRGTRLEDAARRLARLASTTDIREVDREVIIEVEFDEIPSAIEALADRTFILFEAEGFCVEEAGLENKLHFDAFGGLKTEDDRNFIFPDFSLGGANPGFKIDYESGAALDLTRGQDVGFAAMVTPIFTGTQLDGAGMITMERRFLAEIEFEVEVFTTTTATTEQLFNAAFINGELSGDILEFDLILVDLQENTPVAELGRVRYHDQNVLAPEERLYRCDVVVGAETGEGIDCPPDAAVVGREFEVGFVGRDRSREVDYDWFVSDGWGYVKNPFDPLVSVVPTAEGLLEVTLILSDLSAEPEVFEFYSCQVVVGEIEGTEGLEGYLDCPTELTVGERGFFTASAALDTSAFFDLELFVFGTSEYEASLDPIAEQAEIVFWETGRFEVGVLAYGLDGSEEYFFCEVLVSAGHEEDFCALWDWYGDGICDLDCLDPDPDCDVEVDWCAELGWYGDGFCDQDCPAPDPDCDEPDFCDELGYYGDGICDECPLPDPDCEAIECLSNSDCGFGEICFGGFCVFDEEPLGCFDDLDCEFDEFCVNGICEFIIGVVECVDDSECGFDEFCVGGICEFIASVAECVDDLDCEFDEFCVDGLCLFLLE